MSRKLALKKALTDPKYLAELLTSGKFFEEEIVEQFTVPQLDTLVREIQQLRKLEQTRKHIPPDPVDFAIKHSRGGFVDGKFPRFIGAHLAAVARGEEKRLIISAAVRHGKSFLTSCWFPLWYLAKFPDRSIMLITATQKLAIDWSYWIRDRIITIGDELGLRLSADARSVLSWRLESGGSFQVASVGTSIVGRGADLIVIDDYYADEPSEADRDRVWTWYQTSLVSRFEAKTAAVILCSRWHQDDLSGRLLGLTYDDGRPIWHEIKLPALAEENDPLGRAVGEPLFPERIPLERVLELKQQQRSPYHWSALYQQRPSPEEGGIVKRDWWQFYNYEQRPSEFDEWILSFDPSLKGTKRADYAVIQIWARTGARFYLIDQVRSKMDTPDMMQALRLALFSYPQIGAKLIEDTAAGPGVRAMLTREGIPGIIAWPPKGSKRRKESKEERLKAVTPLIQAGNVFIPIDKPWWEEFVEEICTFPNATHDDQVDALTIALDYIGTKGARYLEKGQRSALALPKPVTTTAEILGLELKAENEKALRRFEKAHNAQHWRPLARLGLTRRGRILW